jgi:peptidoglycan/xylan/chitin deacetylase (PgdA/CDA1 family)
MASEKNKKYCLLTNDVETTSIWFNDLRDDTGLKVMKEGLPLLLDIYEKYNIKSTFFFTGYIAQKFPEVVKMVVPYGHEVASHSMSHLKKNGHDVMNLAKQIKMLSESKKVLEDISGQEVISFRAPALRVNDFTATALIETGYKIDSSVASQRFDMFLSFGGIKKLNWLTAPRLPYRTSSKSLFKKGDAPLIEVPLSATLFPYVGTTMRLFPAISKLQRNFLHWETRINNKPIVFDIHPNEFIDESGEPRNINRRSKNPVSYFLQDYLRAHLKVKNLGLKALPLYESQIKFFHQRNYSFCTIKEYCKQIGLLK